MKKLLIMFILFLINLSTVQAGLMVGEGSINLKPFDKKMICGGACVFSTVNYTTTTYSVAVSEEIERFIDRIEPQDFTLVGIDCPAESEPRRDCIKNLCSQEKTESTQTLCIYFDAPLEFALETDSGIPTEPKEKEYRGAIRAVGRVGAATIVEPLSFSVYYTPFNGWIIVVIIVILAVIVVCLLIIKLKYKKKRKKSNL